MAEILENQLWRRKIDQKNVLVISTVGGVVFYCEYENVRNSGIRSARQWLDQCYLLPPDEVLEITGGIF